MSWREDFCRSLCPQKASDSLRLSELVCEVPNTSKGALTLKKIVERPVFKTTNLERQLLQKEVVR